MLRLALANLRLYAPRFAATALAVVVGVGFLASGLLLTTAMKDALDGNVAEQYARVDLVVQPAASLQGLDVAAVPTEQLERTRATPGVAAAAGELVRSARLLDAQGDTVTARSQGRAWIEDPGLNPLRLVEGSAPVGTDQVALDRDSARSAGLRVGDTARLATPAGEVRARVTGITAFGDQDALDDGGTISFSPEGAITVLNSGLPGWDHLLVRTSGDAAEVRRALSSDLPPTLEVLTGDEFRRLQQEQSSGLVDLLRPALNGFAYLALFVAGFVIFNTFTVVVSQRLRELALVRAVGGTPGQVRRSLLAEGLVVGVVASAVGIAAGALLAVGIKALLGLFDLRIPGSGVALTGGTVVWCLLAGTIVTVVSVAVPAFRAGRTRPVEAMRESAVDRSGTSAVRAWIGGISLVLGVLLLVAFRAELLGWPALAAGTLLLFAGLLVGGPLLARLLGRLVGRPMRALGVTGRLASDNAVRNPRRTATTANALVIGLFLVTLVTASGEALKTWTVRQLDRLSSSDFIVAANGVPIGDRLVQDIRDTRGVAAAAPVRTATVLDRQGRLVVLSGADPAVLQRTTGLKATSGSLERIATAGEAGTVDLASFGGGGGGGSGGGGDAGPGSDRQIAPSPDGVGSSFEVVDAAGAPTTVTVGATLEAKIDTLFLGTLVSDARFRELAGDRPVNQVFVRTEPGAADQVGARLDRLVRDYAGVEVQPGNFLGQIVGQVFDFLIGAVNALLGISVLIALIGIVNTLTLSLYERRSELGMLRALGMQRRQVSRMVRLEAVLIGVLGTVVGMGAGLLLSWVVIGSIGSGEVDLNLNWARLGLIAVVGLLVGVIASLLPARRATRLAVLDAISTT
ncbi:MAG: ABC transporter permease [Microthrixaceae bacterium]